MAVALTLPLAATMARAAESQEAARASARQLAGHVFTLSQYVTSPFSFWEVGNLTTFGQGTATGNTYDRRLNVTGTRDHDVVGFNEEIDFSARLAHFLSLRANVASTVFSGTDARGLLAVGTTAQVYGGAGLTLGWNLGENLRAAFIFDSSVRPAYNVLIGEGILEAARTGEMPTLLQKETVFRTEPGVAVAWAPNPIFGMVGRAAFVYSRLINDDSSFGERIRKGMELGVSADVDLDPLWRVPIAVLLLYNWEGSGELTRLQTYGGGVFYTRRVNLQLGLEVVRREQLLRPDVNGLPLKAVLGSFVFRFYW
jgi:hypothetical protein